VSGASAPDTVAFPQFDALVHTPSTGCRYYPSTAVSFDTGVDTWTTTFLPDLDDGPPPWDDEPPYDEPPARPRARGGDRSPAPASPGGRVPPHNIDAEESLLGAMLLSRTAIDVVSESMEPRFFYKPAHAHIYEAITSLSAAGEPVDPVTVAEELRRHDLLDAIGGPGHSCRCRRPRRPPPARLATPSIVEEHSMLRAIIGAAGEIAEMGYSLPDDVTKALDQAENMMFQVAQHRQTDSMSRLHDLLDQTLDSLEALVERGDAITGTPTGYIDFDELTSGLQPNALVVVGARPGMGKTSFAMGMAATPRSRPSGRCCSSRWR
jgi:replicative DNA helicase